MREAPHHLTPPEVERQAATPETTVNCWPVDTAVCPEWATFPAEIQARALLLATQTLRMLTGYQVGGCPRTYRPCPQECSDGPYYLTGNGFLPVNYAGIWRNCGNCYNCRSAAELQLPPPVGEVTQVKVDGVVLDPADYQVWENRLRRTDGGQWPSVQNFDLPDTAVGTHSVTYLRGHPVDTLGEQMAGVLACEYAKGASGGKCRLPSGVTEIARQGVTYTVTPGAFPDGRTGLREVDAYLANWNPHALKRGSTVWFPEMDRGRWVR